MTRAEPGPPELFASIAAGRQWLEAHSADVLPDTLVFARIGLRAAGLSFPERLRRPHAGRIARALIPLSPAFRAVASGAGRLYLRSRGKPPFAAERASFANRETGPRRHDEGVSPLDRATINRALADAVRGRLSSPSLRWMRQPRRTGFVLTHQLLAWLFCVWNGCRDDAVARARRLARRVFREAVHVRGYHDLLAQQTAFLALGGWPAAGLPPLIRRVLGSQDADDGGWHYFERRLAGASETLSRVCEGRSPLLGWPIACPEDQFAALVSTVHHAHRGHATALSICVLGLFSRATGQSSTDSRLHTLSAASTGTSGSAWISSCGEVARGSTSSAALKKKAASSG